MAYSLPRLFSNKFNKRELKEFAEEHKKKPVTFLESVNEGEKIAFGVPKFEHTVGKIVVYDGKYMVIRKVIKNGIILEPVEVKDGNLIDNPLPKAVFVKEKDYHKVVHTHPLFALT